MEGECLKSDSDFLPNQDDKWYLNLVNTVLQSHKALSLKQFRISFRVNQSDKYAVTKWLEFVFSRQVESLELDFKCWDEEYKVVLEELLRESRTGLQPQTDLIFFQSLKSLCLQSLKVSGEDIELFLRNCPLLEILEIYWATLTSDVEICGTTLMLKHLDVHGCRGLEKSIKVSAPNLTCMRITDRTGKLLFDAPPKLVMANFEISRSDSVAQIFPSLASCYFSQLESLNLKLWEIKLPVILANGFPVMPNLKKLVIISYETYNHSFLSVVTPLLWASPRLEEFKLNYRNGGQDQHAYMQVMADDERSPHQHLQVFELRMSHGQTVNDHTVELVTYCCAGYKPRATRSKTFQEVQVFDRSYLSLSALRLTLSSHRAPSSPAQ